MFVHGPSYFVTISPPPPPLQLVFSQLKCLQALLSRSPVLQSSPHLTNLLAVLRAAMTLGLPGQPHTLQAALPLALPVVQSPKIVTPPPPSPKQRPQTIAGPQPRRRQKRAKDHKNTSKVGRSQESNDGEASLGDHVKLRPAVSFGGRGCSLSSSESDVSDSEPAPNQIKVVHGKIRHLAFSCLTAVFKVIPLSLHVFCSVLFRSIVSFNLSIALKLLNPGLCTCYVRELNVAYPRVQQFSRNGLEPSEMFAVIFVF